MAIATALSALRIASVVLHEGHAHGGEAGGVGFPVVLLGILGVGAVGIGTYYAYRQGLLAN